MTESSRQSIELLTEREREVFDLCALARTNVEIAEKLGMSVKTVETHRARINKKIGVSSPAQLVVFAVREGLLDQKKARRG